MSSTFAIEPERLGVLLAPYETALRRLEEDEIPERIWRRDHTVWSDSPDEITNRLGWLDLPESMMNEVDCINALRDEVRELGWDRVVLLGMGGSSLAPELFARVFPGDGRVRLSVLDSTDPAAVLAVERELDMPRTLLLVATKSGTTVETVSLFKHFYGRAREALGDEAASHFVAITDPGSALEATAGELGFRATFLNDPDLGGRFSALSFFGLVPAGLIGTDLAGLLARAIEVSNACGPDVPIERNPGARLGALLGAAASEGRDKLALLAANPIAGFGDWAEQLIAESTGKSGRGVLPVVGEPGSGASVPDGEGVTVLLRVDGEPAGATEAREPHALVELDDVYDIGGQFFMWEMATAVAGHILGIHPFNQPNVESAKVRAREMVAASRRQGVIPAPQAAFSDGDIAVSGDVDGSSLRDALRHALGAVTTSAYAAVQAYIPATPQHDKLLLALREALAKHGSCSATIGYGPRFLHSTGQLHKGDAGKGLFLQVTADHPEDLPIPDEPGSSESSLTFGTLIDAQAAGDMQALQDGGRRVIRFHLGRDVSSGLARLTREVSALG